MDVSEIERDDPARTYEWRYSPRPVRDDMPPMRKRPIQYDQGTVGKTLGLPEMIEGNPLPCTCSEAYLAGVSEVVNGEVEADYTCSSGWHNYVVFLLRSNDEEESDAINKATGEVGKVSGYKADQLEEL